MKKRLFAFLIGVSHFLSLFAIAKESTEARPAAIREFDVATLSRLGREIYLHDQLAWKATDVVLAQIGMERLRKDGSRGWIVEASNPKAQVVRFIRAGQAGMEVLCDVTFVDGGSPELSVPAERALSARQRVQVDALEIAKARFFEGKLPWCGGNPNTVVLDDPDGSGFLVYFLRAKPAMDKIPIGGHYRFTVSSDGRKVEQVDRLFASCLTLPKQPPEGGTPVELFMTHLVSSTPLETHVFLSLQDGIPFAIGTPDRTLWLVKDGEITRQGTLDESKR